MKLPKLKSLVRWDKAMWSLEDIVMCNGKGVTTGIADGATLHYELSEVLEDREAPNRSARIAADACFVIGYDRDDEQDFFDQDSRSPHLDELGYKMVSWLDGLEDQPDNVKLPEIVTLLMAIQYDKERHYGSSWKGKGEYRGVMANIDRKYDRLDKMTHDEIEGTLQSLASLEARDDVYGMAKGYESKIDAVADLANYCLLYMTYMKDNYPKMFNSWVQNNVPKYLADKIPFVAK